MVLDFKRILYNTVLSQTISSDGKFVFHGNTFGDIFVTSTADFANPDEDEILLFTMGKLPINSLAFHSQFLIVGTVGLISGYKWNAKNKQCLTKPNWTVQIPIVPESIETTTDINSMYIDDESNLLYAGCGDSKMYQIDLENGKIVRTFKGHKDYIHCVTGYENQIYSASEDGNILFWNSNEVNSTGTLKPHKYTNLMRPEFGKWQGTVSVTNDWLICGGGPKLSMWHLRSMECTKEFPYPGKIHFSNFLDDLIVVAGEYKDVHHYTFNGETVVEMPINYAAVYSIVWQKEPKFMSIAGTNNKVQIMTDFRYVDTSRDLYKEE